MYIYFFFICAVENERDTRVSGRDEYTMKIEHGESIAPPKQHTNDSATMEMLTDFNRIGYSLLDMHTR